MIATYNPEEGPLREHLLDRIAMTLSADVASTFEQRVFAVESATRFQDKPQEMLDEAEETTDNLRTQVGGCPRLFWQLRRELRNVGASRQVAGSSCPALACGPCGTACSAHRPSVPPA
jgi:Mg-chelatase subunit ChlI